ncbi:MAG: hypothetical protein IJZ19_00135 [Lentisphaeria bacterium]|nr:hypothetical protein [Lentisphaeria bacterium]
MNNPNSEAVRIARADLAAICHAVNVMQPRDTIELHNLPLTIVVKCRKNQDDEIVNEIKGYAPKASLSGAVAAPPSASPTSSATGNSQYYWLFRRVYDMHSCMARAEQMLDEHSQLEYNELKRRILTYTPASWIKENEIENFE